jgi:hypothetical protein
MKRLLVVLACALALGIGAASAEEPAAKRPLTLSTSGTMRDALMRLGDGAEVEISLANGKSYRGKLGSVGDHSVIVTELAGKEFYDALIKLDDISALEVRVRGR